MTFNEFINESTSKKIVVFEIDEGVFMTEGLWTKYSSRVWKTTYSWTSGAAVTTTKYGVGTWGAGTYGLTSSSTLPRSPHSPGNLVNSLDINNVNYTLVGALSSVEGTVNSFYWDKINQILYIHFDGYLPDTDNAISLGLTTGWASENMYSDNIFFDGRVKSIPQVKVLRDNLFDGKVVTIGGSITLINTDGYFDHFRNRDIYGKKMRLKFGGAELDYDDYETIYTGYIEKFDNRGTDTVINVKDERKNLERKIPTVYLEESDHPYLVDIGAAVGIGYGVINRAPAICVNEDETAATYNFIFVDTTHHNIESINQVYIDGVKVTHTNGSLTGGTFDLSSSDYSPGQTVSVSFNGYTDGVDLIENPLDIIEDLILIYNNILYSSDFYNTVDWDALRPTLPNIALYVHNSSMLKNIIGDIAHTILGTFIIEGDGRFNMKVVDLTKTAVGTIKAYEYTVAPVEVNPSAEYISSARVGYNQAHTNMNYSYAINTDDESTLVTKYRSYKQKDFNTLLVEADDAADYSDMCMILFGGIIPYFTIKTGIQNINIELEDIVNAELYVFDDGSHGIVKTEVISKSVNYTSNEITFILKYISDVTANLNRAKFIKSKPGVAYKNNNWMNI